MKVRVVHAFPTGDVPRAGAGATKARRVYYINQALAKVCDPLHVPTHDMLLTWEEGDLIVDPTPPFRLPLVGPPSWPSPKLLTPNALRCALSGPWARLVV
jgi:hypothetical protein